MLVVLILVAVDLSPALFCIANFELCLLYPMNSDWLQRIFLSTEYCANLQSVLSSCHMTIGMAVEGNPCNLSSSL